ncbi:MAG: alanine--tRNA ligase [Myxococcota bacterium]
MVKSADLRRSFIEYFKRQGHAEVASAPLIPENDPTLMFVNAGMVPFKDVFTGKDKRDYARACSAQKCIRISGKHNDLENVGVTARHHTFFEMLGNFSFGDYFKEEAIAFAWELLTREWQVPADKLVITVFKGEDGFAADDEAAALWKKISGFGDDRILRLGSSENFWSMGDTGPCGPSSEIHYFHGEGAPDPATFGEEPGVDGTGWTEVWNLVFMQYDRAAKGAAATPLPAPCVDTGAGLERVASMIQGVTSNYDTDLMRGLVELTADLAKKNYTAAMTHDDISMRVVADHARTTAFLMAEGVTPNNTKREYVLRRVMRRAIRHGHRLGIDEPFLHLVALAVVDHMGADYPELRERREMIEKSTEGEEIRFRRTLRRGMAILDERFAGLDRKGTLGAEPAADLYTTYGFPLDLTEVIAHERGFSVDRSGAEARIKGGAGQEKGDIDPNAALDPAYRQLAQAVGPTEFIGYEHESGRSRVVGIIRLDGEEKTRVDSAEAGAEVEVAVETTPFYAESGGQVGDRGVISTDTMNLEVVDTQKPFGGVYLHRGPVAGGALRVGDEVTLTVDHEARSATRRNHSATHLLHWALREVLGEHAQQKGSLVGPDGLRFDFAHNQPLSPEEIERVEDLVNAKVLTNAPVETDVLTMVEAKEKGAMAIFEEKYGDTVRVLTMTDDSVELCGGTHCMRLGDIGLFKIVGEGGTASGVRRVMAATGAQALAFVRGVQAELARVRVAAKAQNAADVAEKVAKIVQHEKELERRVKKLERELAEGGGSGGGGGIETLLAGAKEIAGVKALGVEVAEGTSMNAMVEVAEKLRDKLGGPAVVLTAAKAKGKAQLAVVVEKELSKRLQAGAVIEAAAAHVGGKGGGRPDMARAGGTDVAGIPQAVDSLYLTVEGMLRG